MAVSTQHLLHGAAFQVIYFCDFLPARKSVSVKDCCFSLWRCDAALSEDAEMHCSYPGLRIYVLFVDAGESTGLNDEQAASAPLPIKKLIVCPSRKGNDPPTPSSSPDLHISHTHGNSKVTAFDFACMRTERSAPAAASPSIPILPFDAFLYLEIIFFENSPPSFETWKRGPGGVGFFFLVSHPSRVHFSAESSRRSSSTPNWKVISLWPRRGYMCDWGDWNYLQIFQ